MFRFHKALNVLCKWRSVFAGWQLGTRPKGDPESDAVRDHREVTMLLRVEVNTLTRLLRDKGVFTEEEYGLRAIAEADELCKAYEQQFPGYKATELGMQVDVAKAAETSKGWRP